MLIVTATAIYSLGHGLCTFTAVPSPGIVFIKFPGRGKSGKSKCEVLKSPGIC